MCGVWRVVWALMGLKASTCNSNFPFLRGGFKRQGGHQHPGGHQRPERHQRRPGKAKECRRRPFEGPVNGLIKGS